MYDYLLGGHYNYPCDREACDQLLMTAPSTRELALNNRAFLERVVRHIARRYGIRQFLDHGSGLPTQNNVHQVAQSVDPDSKVVYIDNDPLVLGYGRAFLEENRNVLILPSDMRETAAIAADAARIIDFEAGRWPRCSYRCCTACPTTTGGTPAGWSRTPCACSPPAASWCSASSSARRPRSGTRSPS